MTLVALLGLTILFALIGTPLVFAIMAASVVTLVLFLPTVPLVILPQLFINGMDKSLLLAIVFFFLAGELMNRGGITRRIVDFAQCLVGHIRGGLGHVNIVSSIFFSGISGSAVADTAAVGTVMVPAMVKRGYGAGFSAAITQTSSVIGPIIPPSIPIIIYAVLAEVSVGKMFLAGVVPGLLIGLCLMAAVYVISVQRDYPREDTASFGDILRSFWRAFLALLTPLIIIGGILSGSFTATEAGAVAVAYAFLLGKFILRELTWADCGQALIAAARGTATVMVILGASTLFAWIVANLQISRDVAAFLFSVTENPWLLLLGVNLFILMVGLFMDPLAAMIIIVPIFLPAMVEVGVDPIHFGIFTVINLMIGLCTPPVGYLIYLSASIAKVRPEVVVRESLPFLVALLVALLLCIYIPALSLWLPGFYAR